MLISFLKRGYIAFSKVIFYQFFSVLLKSITTILWLVLGKPEFLGFFSLLSMPASIGASSMMAGNLVMSQLPGKAIEVKRSLLKAALTIDVVLILISIFIFLIYSISSNSTGFALLGYVTMSVAFVAAFLEAIVSLATLSSLIEGMPKWYFLLSNSRTVFVIAIQCLLLFRKKFVENSSGGLVLFLVPLLATLFLSVYFFFRTNQNFISTPANRSFLSHFRESIKGIIFYRIGYLLATNSASIYMLTLDSTLSVGHFSMAWTLSNFIAYSISPVVQQVFLPKMSIYSREGKRRDILKILFQGSFVALLMGIVLSMGAQLLLPIVLEKLGKNSFEGSESFLRSLLVFQIFSGASFAAIHFFMARRLYAELAMIYFIMAISGLVSFFVFVHNEDKHWIYSIMGLVVFVYSNWRAVRFVKFSKMEMLK